MTNIYDFNDKIFYTYKKEWSTIFNAIKQYANLKQNVLYTDDCYNIFKKHSPSLWDNCPDDIIYKFIIRASQINYYELDYVD